MPVAQLMRRVLSMIVGFYNDDPVEHELGLELLLLLIQVKRRRFGSFPRERTFLVLLSKVRLTSSRGYRYEREVRSLLSLGLQELERQSVLA